MLLAIIDIDHRRLPDVLTLPATPVMLASPLLPSGPPVGSLRVLSGRGTSAFYFVLLHLSCGDGPRRRQACTLLGVALGWISLGPRGGEPSRVRSRSRDRKAAIAIARRSGRKTAIPSAPSMLTGTLIALLAGNQLTSWYLGLFSETQLYASRQVPPYTGRYSKRVNREVVVTNTSIGLEITSLCVRMAEVQLGKDGMTLQGMAERPLPAGAVVAGEVRDPKRSPHKLIRSGIARECAVRRSFSALRAVGSRYGTRPCPGCRKGISRERPIAVCRRRAAVRLCRGGDGFRDRR